MSDTVPVLVTSVPVVHLREVAGQPKAAFGSRLVDTLQRFDDEAGAGARVFIHGSLDEAAISPVPETVEWVATWETWEPAVGNGAASKRIRWFRPPSERDESGWFFAFYVVSGLNKLEKPMSLREFGSWRTDEDFAPAFIPRGPVLARLDRSHGISGPSS